MLLSHEIDTLTNKVLFFPRFIIIIIVAIHQFRKDLLILKKRKKVKLRSQFNVVCLQQQKKRLPIQREILS
jgi:hypothetical protein